MATDLGLATAARAGADVVVSEAELAAAYDRMAAELSARLGDDDAIVLPVMIGGFIPAAELLRRLPQAVEVDYLHATRYRGAQTGGTLEWRAQPKATVAGRTAIVVDDILDEGHTLLAIQHWLREQGAAKVITVVRAEKLHDRRAAAAAADIIGVQVPDRYVFGAGMDLHGYYRQLPAIFAVAESPTSKPS